MKEKHVSFCEPIASYEGDWFAVCGHRDREEAVADIVGNGSLDFVLDQHGLEEGDEAMFAEAFLGDPIHGWVRAATDEDEAPSDNWYYECEEDEPGAFAATIFQA